MNNLEPFFAASAQIIFTIFGFVLVALTIDRKTRDYWFSNERQRYTIIHLLSITLPGLLALVGTISIVPSPQAFSHIRAWVYASALIGILYIILLGEAKKEKRGAGEQITKLNKDLGMLSGCLFGIACLDAFFYYIDKFVWLADISIIIYIIAATVYGITSSIAFLKIPQQDTDAIDTDEAITLEIESDEQVLDLRPLSFLVTALLAFLVGIFVSKKGE